LNEIKFAKGLFAFASILAVDDIVGSVFAASVSADSANRHCAEIRDVHTIFFTMMNSLFSSLHTL
jgi:hypothetical protein